VAGESGIAGLDLVAAQEAGQSALAEGDRQVLEEAVQSFLDLNARIMVPMHWGTFRLTDEDMLEPPRRARAAWQAAGLPDARLRILRHGETLIMEG
jgi:L-ascorbate metabolism protein UlaG (beta-lactamase superfamily)